MTLEAQKKWLTCHPSSETSVVQGLNMMDRDDHIPSCSDVGQATCTTRSNVLSGFSLKTIRQSLLRGKWLQVLFWRTGVHSASEKHTTVLLLNCIYSRRYKKGGLCALLVLLYNRKCDWQQFGGHIPTLSGLNSGHGTCSLVIHVVYFKLSAVGLWAATDWPKCFRASWSVC